MRKAFETLDNETRREHVIATMTMHQAFEAAAAHVDELFPNADPVSRRILIKQAGLEIIRGVSLGLEFDETKNNVSEGLVAQMLQLACGSK